MRTIVERTRLRRRSSRRDRWVAALGGQTGRRTPESSTCSAARMLCTFNFNDYNDFPIVEDTSYLIFVILIVATLVYWSASIHLFRLHRYLRWPWHWLWRWGWTLDQWACLYVLLTRPCYSCVTFVAWFFFCGSLYVLHLRHE